MRRRFRHLPIAWLLLLLCVPVVGWALGARQPLLDNRPKTAWPHLSAHALRSEATYQQMDAALLERLPPRKRALSVHGHLAIDVFHDSPNPDVAIGSNGYRYYRLGIDTCEVAASEPIAQPTDIVDILARTLVASGRKTLLLIPGDKLFIHPQDAPTIDKKTQACAAAMERAISDKLAHTPGGFDVDDALRQLEAAGTPVFRRNDTHWNDNGRLLLARKVLNLIRPGLAQQVGLHLGERYDRPGDLAQMVGLTTADPERAVTPTHPPQPPVTPGKVVLIGDSQMEQTFTEPPGPGLQPLLTTTLPGTTSCTQPQLYGGLCDGAIKQSSTIMYETVGRNITEVEQICWRVVSLVVEQGMTGPAARYERLDGVQPLTGTHLTIGASGTMKLHVIVPGPDASATPRLLRMPLAHVPPNVTVTMTQAPAGGGRPAPCATPQQYDHGSLVLPVPAGRRASDMVVTLTGPPGTTVETPRVIALDGTVAPKTKD